MDRGVAVEAGLIVNVRELDLAPVRELSTVTPAEPAAVISVLEMETLS
jgi:hypothetical protein